MRHTSDKQETSLWIALAAVWLTTSLLAWLAALFGIVSVPTISGDKLILLACLLGGGSLALRLPILTSQPKTTCFTNQIVWLLTLAANVNWLGCLCLRAEGWLDTLLSALVLLAGEVWVHRKVDRQGCLPDICKSLSVFHPTKWFSAKAANATTSAFGQIEVQDGYSESPSELGQFERQTFAGLDEAGEPYLSGDIRVALEPLQTTASIVVAFSPTFDGTPVVEFESEVEGSTLVAGADDRERIANEPILSAAGSASAGELVVQLTTCTPAGMRIGLRRSAAAGAKRQAYLLRWYASLPPEGAPAIGNGQANANVNASLP